MATKEGNGSLSAKASQAAHEAIDQVGTRGEQAEQMFRERSQQASARSQEMMDEFTAYIHEHPVTAIGIAIAVGFVLGALLRG